MDYINEKLKCAAGIFLFCALAWTGTAAFAADDAASLFQKANKDYVELCRDVSKKQIRDNWTRVINGFLSIAEKYPDSDFAPEAQAKGAKVSEHFSKYSGRKSDMKAASELYQDTAKKYPKSGIADDSLFNAGLIEEKTGNKDKADQLYRRILDEYARGDMADKAKAKLKAGIVAEIADKKAPADQPKPAKKETAKEAAPKKSDPPAIVKKVRRTPGQGNTRVVIDLDSAASYKVFVASADKRDKKPVRLVIDLKGAKLPSSFPAKEDIEEGIITAVRASQHPDNKVRIVLDLRDKPAYECTKTDDPSKIVIDVADSKASLKAASSSQASTPSQAAAAEQPVPLKQIPVRRVPSGSPSQMRDNVPSIASQLCLKVSKIVIDPGHGGKDPGAISASGVREKDLTLDIAKLLFKRLKAEGFEVWMTRSKDEFLALDERTTFANKKRADLFLSIHINSHQNTAVSGIETYFLNLTTDSTAIEVAARENTFAEKSISDLQLILNDLMLNSKINESSKFANSVHTSVFSSALGTGYDGRNLGVRQAPFYVLLGAQMPSILIELGFLTNTADIGMLKRHTYQETLVDGIAKGINNYIMNTTYAYSWRNK